MIFLKRKGLSGLALVVICVIIAGSVMCPFACAAEPPDVILPKLDELKEVISSAVDIYPTLLTDTNTLQQANALYNKIDAVMVMVEEGDYRDAAKKLENDISPKIAVPPDPYHARSWLSDDPALQPVVEEFAGWCQEIIEDILDGLTNYNG